MSSTLRINGPSQTGSPSLTKYAKEKSIATRTVHIETALATRLSRLPTNCTVCKPDDHGESSGSSSTPGYAAFSSLTKAERLGDSGSPHLESSLLHQLMELLEVCRCVVEVEDV